MAFKIFVDTNVYLDVLLQRGNSWQTAESIFTLAEQGKLEVYTSSSSLLNIMYILRVYKIPAAKVSETAKDILNFTRLTDPDNITFEIALSSKFRDKEDAVQYYTALNHGKINYFVTSNLKDYKHSIPQLKVLSPVEFAAAFEAE